MSDFRQITETFIASPQISEAELAAAKAMGVTTVVNNRPDGEAPDQPAAADLEAAARAQGMRYFAIPVSPGGFRIEQVEQMQDVLGTADGAVLAFCRSGTRSTLLWALARAASGQDPATIAAAADAGGYSVAPIRPTMDMLAARAAD